MSAPMHTPQVGDWVVTFGYGVKARQVVAVKPKTLRVTSEWGGKRLDQVRIDDIKAFSPDKAAIDLLVERIKSAIAERDARFRRANEAMIETRTKLLADFAKARGDA